MDAEQADVEARFTELRAAWNKRVRDLTDAQGHIKAIDLQRIQKELGVTRDQMARAKQALGIK